MFFDKFIDFCVCTFSNFFDPDQRGIWLPENDDPGKDTPPQKWSENGPKTVPVRIPVSQSELKSKANYHEFQFTVGKEA
jgi:hypothetical protein